MSKIRFMPQWRYWHSSLVNGEHPLLSKDRRIDKDSLIIARKLEYYGYSIYYPYYTFIHECYKLPLENRCFFEVILGSQSQKPYFDLDIELTKPEFIGWDLEKAKLAVKDLIRSIMEMSTHFPGASGIKIEDIMVFSSHGKDKFSFHVVIDRWCFPDFMSNKFFCEKVINNMELHLFPAADLRIYTSVRQFRTYMSTKYQKGRTKILESSDLCSWKPLSWNGLSSNPARRFYQIFFASLVTVTSTCKIIGYELPVSVVKDYGEQDDLPEKAVEMINSTVDVIIDGDYEILNIEGRRIGLKRLKSSYCQLCERIHGDNVRGGGDNAFLTVTSDGLVWYHCFRNDPKNRIIVAAIGSETLSAAVENIIEKEELEKPVEEEKISGARLFRRLVGTSEKNTSEKRLRYLIQ
jgi:hypothetical protein